MLADASTVSIWGGVFQFPWETTAPTFNPPRGLDLAPRATIDFETLSALDIKKYGAWLYSRHVSTSVRCLSFKLPKQELVQWVEGDPIDKLQPLIDWIRKGGLIEAHNSFFERCIWANCFRKLFPQLPKISLKQWRCSAAKARAWGLPGSLSEACKAVGSIELKDEGGKKEMLFFCRPRPKRKGKPVEFNQPEDHPERWQRFLEYNRQDVIAEEAFSLSIPDLSPFEQRVWEADQRANWRGVKIDIALCKAALKIEEELKDRLAKQLFKLTGIESYSKRAQIKEWLAGRGVELPNTQADTLERFANDPAIKGANQRVIRIARDANKTSVAKFKRMLEMCDTDGVVRDLILYHGAATGRWSGKGIQVQNYPRGILEELGLTIDEAVKLVKTESFAVLYKRFGAKLLAFLSSCLRGALIPREGKKFIVADYSAIEARVVLWLAEDEKALDIFRKGEDIYCEMATTLYKRPITKKDKRERQFGKMVILALGYGMGFITFAIRMLMDGTRFTEEEAKSIVGDKFDKYSDWVRKQLYPKQTDFQDAELSEEENEIAFKRAATAATMNRGRIEKQVHVSTIDIFHELVLCKYVVDIYRKRFSPVRELWKSYQICALDALKCAGLPIECGPVTFYYDGKVLQQWLPSGRPIIYYDPSIKLRKDPKGEDTEVICFKGVEQKTGKFRTRETYGAMLVERASQGTARDAMSIALVRADENKLYSPILTVHDEILCEVTEGKEDVEDFEALMIELGPVFAKCPIKAEGASFNCYRK